MATPGKTSEVDPFHVYRAEHTPADLAQTWTGWDTKWAARLFILGGCWPLVATSYLFGEQKAVWLWDMLRRDDTSLLVLTMLPFAAAMLILLSRRVTRIKLRASLQFTLGLAALVLFSFLKFDDDAMLLGASILLIGISTRIFLLAVVLAAAGVAVGNRLRKLFPSGRTPRFLSGLGGLVITAAFFVPIMDGMPLFTAFFSLSSWSSEWAFNLALFGLFAYGLLGTANGLRRGSGDRLCRLLSVTSRLVLVGLPLALIIDFSKSSSDSVAMIMNGGPWPMIMALVKLGSIYYAAMLLLALGLSGWLGSVLWERASQSTTERAGEARQRQAQTHDLVEQEESETTPEVVGSSQ